MGAARRWMGKQMMRVHRRGGYKFQGMNLLFLTTTGRKSGVARTTAIAWFPGPDGSWLVVASNAGSDKHPAWFGNITAHPDQVSVELAGRTAAVTADQLSGEAREQAWRQITAAQPRYAKYQQKTSRELPVIRLTPRPD
jgi:deazaflavin-dependent oxidoreductase (nitroreductase family)